MLTYIEMHHFTLLHQTNSKCGNLQINKGTVTLQHLPSVMDRHLL